MIYYTQKNPKDATRKQLESFNEFAKVTESKINTKNVFHLYTPAMKDQKEIKEIIPFTIASKSIKYLGINLPKQTKDLYSTNYKVMMKQNKDEVN